MQKNILIGLIHCVVDDPTYLSIGKFHSRILSLLLSSHSLSDKHTHTHTAHSNIHSAFCIGP